jgi:SAM-dependent methyltransferase
MNTKLNLKYYKCEDLYSNDEIGNEILKIVKDNDDYTDILHNTDNWEIMYHLSPARKNLLDWYDFNKESNLLELGGECGALTGMFAQKLKDVKVLESSKERANITYNRHKNFNNLEVIVGNLHDIKLNEKFDYITLINILKYVDEATDSEELNKSFLEDIKKYLSHKGKILIAIENKFGLKYWAGANEEHTGKIFNGIENNMDNDEIKTFGKKELEDLLKSAGFKNINFYYPMPDHKLPKLIYSDEYLPGAGEIFDVHSPNYDQERTVLFNEGKAYKNIIKNDEFPFFANSFLIEGAI